MTDRTRYHAQTIFQEKGDVTSYLGVDPVTGLPVLIYRFADAASPQLARLDSEHLPRLLAWRDDDTGGIMVVSWSSALVPVSGQPLDNLQLLDSARALNDAAAAGVAHGDLSPDRFFLAGDSIVIEGFGVPWTGQPTAPQDDVTAWARSIRQLGHKGNPGVGRLLDDIEAGADVQPAELFSRLTDLLLRSDPVEAEPAMEPTAPQPAPDPSESAGDLLERSWDDFAGQDEQYLAFTGTASQAPEVEDLELNFSADADDPAETATEAPETAVFIPSSTYSSERLAARDGPEDDTATTPAATEPPQPDPEDIDDPTDPEPQEVLQPDSRPPAPLSLPAGGSSSYLKSLDGGTPPSRTARSVGVTGQSGVTNGGKPRTAAPEQDWEPEPSVQRGSRRIIMITVLAVLTVVLVTLLLVLRQRDVNQVPAGVSAGVTYMVDVLVDPDNVPPVNLFVLQSPSGSQFAPNTALGTAPRTRLALDVEGVWVFEGRFQGRRSEPVTIRIPEDRSSTVTIVIPPEQTDGQ